MSETPKKWHNLGWDRKIEVAAIVMTVLVTLAYTGVSLALWSITKQNAAFSRDVVERPYVVIVTIGPVTDKARGFAFETGYQPAFTVLFRNAGRNPAANIHVNITL